MPFAKRPQPNIYVRLVLTFLLILTPLYIVSTQMNRSGERTVKQEISASMLDKVHFYMGLLEQDFNKVAKLGREYITDDDIGKLSVAASVLPDYEKTRAMLRLQKQMLLLKASSSYIANASIHISSLNRTISANEEVIPTPVDEFRALSVPPNHYNSPFIAWDNRLFISYPYPEYARPERIPAFLVDIEIDPREIVRALRSIIDNEEGGAILADNHFQWSISSNPESETDSALRERIAEKIKSGAAKGVESLKVGSERYFISFENSSAMDATLLTYLPEGSVLGPLDKYRSWFLMLSVVSAFIIVFFSYVIYRIIHRPLRTLVRAFRAVEQGRFNHTVSYRFKDEFSYLYGQFNAMVEHLRVLIHEVYEQKYRAQNSEFRQLQSQINPHFLYNSFFTLSRMASNEDYESVSRFTQYLGQYFQFITRDGAAQTTLEAEWNFARTYVDIQTFRFGTRIAVRFADLPPAYAKMEVPRLIIQPIIENVYNHGLANKKRGGRIEVTIRELEDALALAVEDNGEELSDAMLRDLQSKLVPGQSPLETSGLVNVHRRIQIGFGDRFGMQLMRGQLGGLRVVIQIPKEGRELHVPLAGRG